MGTIGLAPDRALMERTIAREQAALDRGGFVLPPDPTDAVPADPAIAVEALRTIPPRETAGNVDIKQLGKGARLYIPVYADGGLFSAGDAHFAQGDNETCGTAIEMRSTLTVRFAVHKGRAAARGIQDLQFARDDYYLPPEFAAPRRFFATTGLSVTRDGESRPEDLTLAARNALLNMIDHLQDHGGWTRQQAYAICSVAVDLKVSEVVDVPSFVVSAFLPLDIFERVTSWVSRVAVAKSLLTRFLVSPKAIPVAVSPKAKLPPTPPIAERRVALRRCRRAGRWRSRAPTWSACPKTSSVPLEETAVDLAQPVRREQPDAVDLAEQGGVHAGDGPGRGLAARPGCRRQDVGAVAERGVGEQRHRRRP